MSLILAMSRQLHFARDNQVQAPLARHDLRSVPSARTSSAARRCSWSASGRIGSHLAGLARAFGMRVIATKRDPGSGFESADDVFSQGRLAEVLPLADYRALTCPLTPQTEG
jgi:phosphoglycerate dehydrogenase-like enzyme